MKFFYSYQTKIGKIRILQEDEKIIEVSTIFTKDIDYYQKKETIIIKETIKQINEYLDKKRKTFDIPIKMNGTEFQITVWKELCKIPYGQTRTYAEIAKKNRKS